VTVLAAVFMNWFSEEFIPRAESRSLDDARVKASKSQEALSCRLFLAYFHCVTIGITHADCFLEA
jgi:hypothetical protein